MREIVSPLSGIRSPFGGRVDPYKVLGFKPTLVADMSKDYFRNVSRQTFDDIFTTSRLGNATMVDSDGLLKWGPHNLLTYSEDFSNASWTKSSIGSATAPVVIPNDAIAPNGTITADKVVFSRSGDLLGDYSQLVSATVTVEAVNYTGGVWLKAATSSDIGKQLGVRHVGVSTYQVYTLTAEWVKVSNVELGSAGSRSFQFATRGTITADRDVSAHIWGAHLYRSDLGGMALVPPDARVAGSTTYVPTTSTAKYLPRRHNHVYDGSAWVDAGYLHESEARTNLITYSEDFGNAFWPKSDVTVSASGETDPSGGTGAYELIESATTANHLLNKAGLTAATSLTHGSSIYAKANTRSWIRVQNQAPSLSFINVNLSTGAVGTSGGGEDSFNVENVGNGWYRISLFSTPTAASTGPQIFIIDSDRGGASPSYLGDGTSSILIYGAQFEAGPTPSSYIPTNGATATRAAETLTAPSANLPWPTPTVIGDELVTNGTFDTDTSGWTTRVFGGASLSATVSGGEVSLSTTVSGYAFITQAFTTVVGKVYQVAGSISSITGGVFTAIRKADDEVGVTNLVTIKSGAGDADQAFRATATTTYIYLQVNAVGSATFDNISVREINPLAVSIQMEGNMTYADEGAYEVKFYRWQVDAYNRIVGDLNCTSTKTGSFEPYQASSGVADFVVSSPTAYSPGINVPFNIASRHGSTFINGAVDGTVLTENSTPVALPDLSSTDLEIAYDFMGNVKQVRVWAVDIGDTGLEGSTS